MTNYLLAMGVFAALFAILALGLNLIWGLSGMANLGIVGFFGFGAYMSAILTVYGGLPIALGWLLAAVLSGALGGVVCLSTSRLSDDYLAIVTIGFAEVIRIAVESESWLTGGTAGISSIPQPMKHWWGPSFDLGYLIICAVVIAAVLFLLERIRTSPLGRVLRAIREDAMVAATAGKNVLRKKLQAFVIGSAIIGLGGAMYVHYTSYASPELIETQITLNVFLAVVVGGRGNNWGALLGACVVVFFFESSRFVIELIPGLDGEQSGSLRTFLVGLAFLLVLAWRPNGLIPERNEIFRTTENKNDESKVLTFVAFEP